FGSLLPIWTTVASWCGVKPAYQASRFSALWSRPLQLAAWQSLLHVLASQSCQVPVLDAARRPPDSLFLGSPLSMTVDIAQVASPTSSRVRPIPVGAGSDSTVREVRAL